MKTATSQQRPRHGRGTGVPDPVDVHVGNRIRTRRLLIGMNQEALARRLGLTFQQVQESGANRVSASRLQRVADVLEVKVGYFFAGLQAPEAELSSEDKQRRELMQRSETLELVRLYYGIADQRVRSQFLEMVKAVAQTSQPAE